MSERIKPLAPFKGTAEERAKLIEKEAKTRHQLFNKFAKEMYPEKEVGELTFREKQAVYMWVEDQRVSDSFNKRLCSGKE